MPSLRRIKGFPWNSFARGIRVLVVILSLKLAGHRVEGADSTNPPVLDTPASFSTAPVLITDTNASKEAEAAVADEMQNRLATAYVFEKTSQLDKAESAFIGLLDENVPENIKKTALFELGGVIRREDDLPRAETVSAQFIDRWPDDPRVPEIFLRQGQIYRQMGLNNLALTKFYAVMTAALSLKSDRPDYYPDLVIEAQTEIAETHYLMGQFSDAAEFYSRLLKQGNPALNRPQAQFRLIRSLVASDRNDEAASQAEGFITHYPDAAEQPEVRFYYAQTLKKLGRNNEALQQVLFLLRDEKSKTKDQPDLWAYWQQRAGNEVANQLYRDGDYVGALSIYVSLAELDSAPVWQLPVQYQIGLTYERLEQPKKAVEAYEKILKLQPSLGTNSSPGQQAIFQMARWRADFLGWRSHAETTSHILASSSSSPSISSTNAPAPSTSP